MTYTDEERAVFGESVEDWLAGGPMDPAAVSAEPLPTLAGFPFLHAGAGAVIVGPTGGGRSALIEACLYDAAREELRCAYLGSEVTEPEFNARAAYLAECRGDVVDDELRESLARVRYLNLASVVSQAWTDPGAWIDGIAERYDLVAIDPLSAVASALALDFDKSNADFVTFYDRLAQPLTSRGVATVMIDNIGHDPDAKRRAKGASAKGDRADLTFSCASSVSPVGLILRAQKVRSVRAGHERGDEWLFVKDTQRVEARESDGFATFRPTNIMQKISEALERDGGLSKRDIRTTIGGKVANVDLALQLLVSERSVEVREHGQAHRHYSVTAYRELDDTATVTHRDPPCPERVPDTVVETVTHRVPNPVGVGPVTGHGHEVSENGANRDPATTTARQAASADDLDAPSRQ